MEQFIITKAALNVLISATPDNYFTAAKLPCNKNKSIGDLWPYAAEFFKVFLTNKGKFQIQKGNANFRPYDQFGQGHPSSMDHRRLERHNFYEDQDGAHGLQKSAWCDGTGRIV